MPRERGGTVGRRMRPPYELAGEGPSDPADRGEANGRSVPGADAGSGADSDAYPIVGSDSRADSLADERGGGPETTPDLDLDLDSSAGIGAEYDLGSGLESGSGFGAESSFDPGPDPVSESGLESSAGSRPDHHSDSGSDSGSGSGGDTGPDRND